jgi:hypothetical protein
MLDDPDLTEHIKDITLQSRSSKAYVTKLTREEYESALSAAKKEETRAASQFEKEEARKQKIKTAAKVGAAGTLGAGGMWKILDMLGLTPGANPAVPHGR